MLAKVFKSGNSLAIRIPKALNLTKDLEFNIQKIGKSLVLTPTASNWDSLFEAVSEFKGEVKREDLALQERNFG